MIPQRTAADQQYEHYREDDPLYDPEDDVLTDQDDAFLIEAGILWDDAYDYEERDDDALL